MPNALKGKAVKYRIFRPISRFSGVKFVT